MSSFPIYTARGLTKSFNRKAVLKGVSFKANGGDVVAITGPNGSGKSTLLRILSGLLQPDQGQRAVTVAGVAVADNLIIAHCGFTAPYINLYEELTPRELLEFVMQCRGRSRAANKSISTMLEITGLSEFAEQRMETLSTGLRQRCSIAACFIHDPEIIILDEPYLALDQAGRAMLLQRILNMKERGSIIFLATNDERDVRECDTVINLG